MRSRGASSRDHPLVSMMRRQLTADLRGGPQSLLGHLGESGRVARCRSVADLREAARRALPRTVFDFVDGAAEDEVTAARNRSAFSDLELWPRVLRDVSAVSLATTVLGERLNTPILGAPHGAGLLLHPDGEAGIARALHKAGSAYVVSSMASQSVEELARLAPGPKWLQMYMWRDRGFTRELIARARTTDGYGAMVLTVDTPHVGRRERDLRNGFTLPPRVTLRSMLGGAAHPRWAARLLRAPEIGLANVTTRAGAGGPVDLEQYTVAAFDASTTWRDLTWLREQWPGPLALKGVLHPADAALAAEHGVDAIIVSNHGGRQLDHAPAAITALPRVVEAVGGRAEVLVDGGVRRGSDIIKALALGARACLVGRPLIFGLAAGGEAGAARAIALLEDELRSTMALLGCSDVGALDRSYLTPEER